LGDLGHELKTETLEKISDVDVLMIPVGGTYTINAKKAVNVISSLEPGIVIPMHYKTDDLGDLKDKLDDVENFLTEFGVEENGVKRLDKLTLRTKSDIPDESEIYILNPQH
jgi:L-ascorbate metabolism protein UlaG (beta-lactamase superfamily)